MPKALGSVAVPNPAMEHIDENKQANGGPFATLSGKRLTEDGRTSRNNAHTSNDIVKAPSIHGEEAARRQAIAELIFFCGINDLQRCKDIARHWRLQVKDYTVMDYDRRTPLHVAAAEGSFSVVQWLLHEGAAVNPMDRHDKTPLEEAVRNDHTEVVKLLVDNGGRIVQEGDLVKLENSKLQGAVTLNPVGMVAEWEVSPKELTLVEKIGSGEFGDVYKAKWHGSLVAAKLLKRSDEIALGDFRTEIAILRKIAHPNTTQFLGACTKQKPYIIISELMSCSLADAFNKSIVRPSHRRKVEIALDFARGIAYLHNRRQPIIHRDLKPANLMISGNLNADTEQLYLDSGVIKVADFGLSKTVSPVEPSNRRLGMGSMDEAYKLTGETGSYRYMAPEVFRHEPYSVKVDVYSYAMIVFQLFECATPFAGEDPVQAAHEAAMDGLRPTFPPRNQLSAVDQELRKLVTDCWAADAGKRPNFEDIVARLERVLQDLPKHTKFAPAGSGGCCSVQ